MLYTFSLPTKADKVPAGPDWLHEVKYDGYRMMLIREQGRVRLISRGGHDWAWRFPLIITAALKLRQEHFVIDGETVVLGPDGVSDFAALHSGKHDERAQLYAFDMLAGDGEDQRHLPLSLRKTNLARLLKRRIPGVFIAECEQGEIGRDLFRVACNMGLEGIVSKRPDSAYTPGKCRHWAQASPHFSGVLSNKRIKKTEGLSEKNRNPAIDGEDRRERPERIEYWLTV
jgi:bifunctional non-homologous end joining protein LigD